MIWTSSVAFCRTFGAASTAPSVLLLSHLRCCFLSHLRRCICRTFGATSVAPSSLLLSHLRRRFCPTFGAASAAPSSLLLPHLRRRFYRTFGATSVAPLVLLLSHLRRFPPYLRCSVCCAHKPRCAICVMLLSSIPCPRSSRTALQHSLLVKPLRRRECQ